MTVAPEVTTTSTAGNSAASRPRPPRSALTTRHVGNAFAKSAALVVGAAVMWLIVLAIITLLDEGLHANWPGGERRQAVCGRTACTV
jgi:hypothetical protein